MIQTRVIYQNIHFEALIIFYDHFKGVNMAVIYFLKWVFRNNDYFQIIMSQNHGLNI